jgi:protein TonB
MSRTRSVAAAALAAALLLPAAPSIAGPPASPAPSDVLKVGGDVKEPVLVNRVMPAYPEESRANRVQGNVILSAVVDEKGAVSKVEAVESPAPELTKAAVEAVSKWAYRPATKKGKPVKVQMTVTVSFKLQ